MYLNNNLGAFQTSFQNGCSTIASAITEMGVATADTDSPETMAENINSIDKIRISGYTAIVEAKYMDSSGSYSYTFTSDYNAVLVGIGGNGGGGSDDTINYSISYTGSGTAITLGNSTGSYKKRGAYAVLIKNVSIDDVITFKHGGASSYFISELI